MEVAAIAFTLVGTLGIIGRLTTDSRPTKKTVQLYPATWQLQLCGWLAPYSIGLAVLLWIGYGLEAWLR
ncbi:MAG: hypothetical protein ACYCO3_10970 [Mycobacteriales bacterium]